jgi:hypothetical protein
MTLEFIVFYFYIYYKTSSFTSISLFISLSLTSGFNMWNNISDTFSATNGTDQENISKKLGNRYGCYVLSNTSILNVLF